MQHFTQIHALFIKTGRVRDPLASAELLRFCALSDPPHRDLDYARLVFDQMEMPNCFSWNTMIRALCESQRDGDCFDAFQLFVEMLEREGVVPNQFTFPSVFKACARMGRLDEGKQIHGLVVKFGFENDEFVVSNVVRMYALCSVMEDAYVLFRRKEMNGVVLWNVMLVGYVRMGEIESAKKMFDEMPERSVVSFNSMISGYAQNGFFKEAIEVFRKMQMGDVCPNYVTLVSVLPAISHLGALELGKWVHFYAVRKEVKMDEVLGCALVDMYCKCGCIEEALQLFESLPRKNVVTWNAIVGGLAMHGRAETAVDYFAMMQREGTSPNDVTYIGVLSACSHAGLVQEGRSIFNKMFRADEFEPRIEHYACMVDLLGRAGHLQEAEEVLLNMPLKPDDVILKALLGACKKHGDLKRGKRVGELLMKMSPNDSGSYVTLSNMFASSEDWEGVTEMRRTMKEKFIRKDPGCSWIEIDGAIHEFLVEDDSHPKAEEIHIMLEEMSKKLRSVGYRPDTTQVLLNVDDTQKECLLHHHSEKIALAFGLIITKPQTPLRIVKNLRICDDCHSWIKLASSIYNRAITVRDRKRFHHFKDGSCSCKDYW